MSQPPSSLQNTVVSAAALRPEPDSSSQPDFGALFSFWGALSPAERRLLEENARLERFEPGTLIHRSDGGCKGVMAVLSGSLRVFCLSEEGREVTLYRVEAGDVCILSASCLMDSIVFDVLIEAQGETRVCLLPSAVLHRVEEENAQVELFIYKNATEKFSQVLWTLQELLFMKLDQRLARALLDEMRRQGSRELAVTHEMLASLIGSAREVVTKTLRYLAEEGMVTLSRGKVTITDEEKLQGLL